jgi:hypothetical protein
MRVKVISRVEIWSIKTLVEFIESSLNFTLDDTNVVNIYFIVVRFLIKDINVLILYSIIIINSIDYHIFKKYLVAFNNVRDYKYIVNIFYYKTGSWINY